MDNADLEKLKISVGRLSPKFHANTTEYAVTVASNVEEVKITPLTSDGGASCIIKGDATAKTISLTEGRTSNIEVMVTAEDGRTNKTYHLSIKRLSANDACLSQLSTSPGALQPTFSPSVLAYYCDLPSNLTSVTLKTKVEDPGMKVAMRDNSPVGTVNLSAGLTAIEVLVTSVNGSNTTIYTINATRLQCPYAVVLKDGYSPKYCCTACAGVVHCPCVVKDSADGSIYCRQCLMELSRVNKVDPLTGTQLGEGWLKIDQAADKDTSLQPALCTTPAGKVEGNVGDISALIGKQKRSEEMSVEPCQDCSKKVPRGLLEAHKQTSCSSKQIDQPKPVEVKESIWQKMYVDDTFPSGSDAILKAAEWEQKYLALLKNQDPASCNSADIIELASKIASCYATGIRAASKDPRGHIGMGLAMEELFYLEDLFGHKQIIDTSDGESEAQKSSKEEEFMAICQLHGVTAGSSVALQLKAVEAEYKALKEAGQSHKAEHVQQLYQWKSKKILQANKGSYAVDTESPLYRAKVKYEHAMSVKASDHTSLYHLGRVNLLLGEIPAAEVCLKLAASIKPTHSETLFCLGMCLNNQPNLSKPLLTHGLGVYLQMRQDVSEGIRASSYNALHGADFWRATNTLIGEGFLKLASLGGYGFLDKASCLLLGAHLFSSTPNLQKGSTVQQNLWVLLRARAALLEKAVESKMPHTGTICRQISSLIAHCQLPSSEQLREMQMKVFQTGVALEPTSSIALTHLGNGQLQQFEATGDKSWLKAAELSFRASIACEGANIGSIPVPEQLTQQEWWKKRVASTEKKADEAGSKKPAPTTTNAGSKPVATSTGSKPVATSAGSKPVATASKAPTKAPATTAGRGRAQPSTQARGKPTTTPGRGPATSGGKPAVAAAGRGKSGPPGKTTGSIKAPTPGKGVATLGDLKSGNKDQSTEAKPTEKATSPPPPSSSVSPPSSASPPAPATASTGKPNKVTYHPRLGLARTLTKQDGKAKDDSIPFYQEVITMSPEVHDAYIELGEVLAKTNPIAAVDVYCKFPFADPPTFDDAYLHGEIVRLLMSNAAYDDPRLVPSMVAMGRALGIGVLERHQATLEAKFKTGVLRQVYAGVHGKPVDDPDLQAFFKFKYWT